jgi:hypothetical protein
VASCRRRVERIVAQGARTGSAKTQGPVGRVVRDLMLPLVFRFLVTDTSQAWIYDHHIDWDTPVTRRLEAAQLAIQGIGQRGDQPADVLPGGPQVWRDPQ